LSKRADVGTDVIAGKGCGTNHILHWEEIARFRYLLVRGLTGSGKTTLLQWMTVCSASQSFEGQLTDWNNTIPFFIRLRQYVESGLPAPEDWPRLIAPAIADTMLDHWVHHQLTSGRAVASNSPKSPSCIMRVQGRPLSLEPDPSSLISE
jgi:hypothetical protein